MVDLLTSYLPPVSGQTTRGPIRIDETDFASMTNEERLRHLELEGYVVLPKVLDAATIAQVKKEMEDLPVDLAPYSAEQAFANVPPQWHSNKFAELIAHPPIIDFIKLAMGESPIFMLGQYIRSGFGVPGLRLHSDYQPYGSDMPGNFGNATKGWEESSPATIRVLTYLDDLTVERGAYTFLPRSHLSLHEDSNTYVRYDNHPDMVTICLEAGSSIVFNVRSFHGTQPSTEHYTRELMEFAYRPVWARPVGPVTEWDEEAVANAPEVTKPYLLSRNLGQSEPLNPPVQIVCTPEGNEGAGLLTGRWGN